MQKKSTDRQTKTGNAETLTNKATHRADKEQRKLNQALPFSASVSFFIFTRLAHGAITQTPSIPPPRPKVTKVTRIRRPQTTRCLPSNRDVPNDLLGSVNRKSTASSPCPRYSRLTNAKRGIPLPIDRLDRSRKRAAGKYRRKVKKKTRKKTLASGTASGTIVSPRGATVKLALNQPGLRRTRRDPHARTKVGPRDAATDKSRLKRERNARALSAPRGRKFPRYECTQKGKCASEVLPCRATRH